MCEEYLLNYKREYLLEILKHDEIDKHFSIAVNFIKLFETNADLGSYILKEPVEALNLFNESVHRAQDCIKNELNNEGYIKKNNVHVRIFDLPACPELHRTVLPTNKDLGLFLQISGTVVRTTATKLLEHKKDYMCTKCKYIESIKGDYQQRYILQEPKNCSNPTGCTSKTIIPFNNILQQEYCKDYQEIKLQEQISKLGIGTIPTSLWVTLEDDLVDCCKPGDDITICGIVMRRWSTLSSGKNIDVDLVFQANHIQVNNDQRSIVHMTPEIKTQFKEFWEVHKEEPLTGRDIIVASFCPQLCGLYLVKLAVAMVLAGGTQTGGSTDASTRIRSEPHLLVVGDPGTGKSQLLRFASKVVPRSVLTTGIGSTSAGLTVSAVMDDGEWQLEAGALVLADEGICCIDEFSSMKEHDRASIHEAMEQQTISVAKASIVCKLSTRCSVLAATNPKGRCDLSQPLSLNVGIASPLLSRFDLVLTLRDSCDSDWDEVVCDHIVMGHTGVTDADRDKHALWNVELLQAYFTLVKSLQPTLTYGANMILRQYYQVQRQAPGRDTARTTVRLLDSLVRLSQAHARLMFRSEVLVMDAVMAVALVESSMQQAAVVLPKHMDLVHSHIPLNPTASYAELVSLVLGGLNLVDAMNSELSRLQNNGSTGSRHDSSKPQTGAEHICNPTKHMTVDISPTQIVILNENIEKHKVHSGTAPSVVPPNINNLNINKRFNFEHQDLKPDGLPGLTTTTQKRKTIISGKPAKKLKRNNSSVISVTDVEMINLIPSVNDDFEMKQVDVSMSNISSCSLEFQNSLDIEPLKKKNAQEEKCDVNKKLSDLRNKFQFNKKMSSSKVDLNKAENHCVKENDLKCIERCDQKSSTDNQPNIFIDSSMNPKVNVTNAFLQNICSKLNNFKAETRTNKTDNLYSNSGLEPSQKSSKTIFQSQSEIIDLDLNL